MSVQTYHMAYGMKGSGLQIPNQVALQYDANGNGLQFIPNKDGAATDTTGNTPNSFVFTPSSGTEAHASFFTSDGTLAAGLLVCGQTNYNYGGSYLGTINSTGGTLTAFVSVGSNGNPVDVVTGSLPSGVTSISASLVLANGTLTLTVTAGTLTLTSSTDVSASLLPAGDVGAGIGSNSNGAEWALSTFGYVPYTPPPSSGSNSGPSQPTTVTVYESGIVYQAPPASASPTGVFYLPLADGTVLKPGESVTASLSLANKVDAIKVVVGIVGNGALNLDYVPTYTLSNPAVSIPGHVQHLGTVDTAGTSSSAKFAVAYSGENSAQITFTNARQQPVTFNAMASAL